MSETATTERMIVEWQQKVGPNTLDVPIECYANEFVEPGAEDLTLMFAGYGEEEYAAKAAAAHFALRGLAAVVAIAPITHFAPTQKNLEGMSAAAPVAIISALNEKIGRDKDAPVNLGGHSLGGGIAAMSASATPELYKKVALYEPMGFTNAPLPKNKLHKEFELEKRALSLAWHLGVVNSFRPEQAPWKSGNWVAAQETSHRAGEDALHGRLMKEFKVASSLQLQLLMPELVKPNDPSKRLLELQFFAGQTDPVFPPEKIAAALRSVGLNPDELLTSVPGSHCSLISEAGKKQLDYLAAWLRGEVYKPAPEPEPARSGQIAPSLGALPEAA